MRFRNSTRLLTENFRNVYKILLYGLIVAVVAISLSSALILPNLLDILRSAEVTTLVSEGKEFLSAAATTNFCGNSLRASKRRGPSCGG